MKKSPSIILTGIALNALAFNAMADSITFKNDTPTSLYMAVKNATHTEYSAYSQTGWIQDGKVGVIRSNDDHLINMGIHPNDSYILGFYDGATDTFGDCGEVISGTNRDFTYENGRCVEITPNNNLAA